MPIDENAWEKDDRRKQLRLLSRLAERIFLLSNVSMSHVRAWVCKGDWLDYSKGRDQYPSEEHCHREVA